MREQKRKRGRLFHSRAESGRERESKREFLQSRGETERDRAKQKRGILFQSRAKSERGRKQRREAISV